MAPPSRNILPLPLGVDPPPREPRQRLPLHPQRLGLRGDGLRGPLDLADRAQQLRLVARRGARVRGAGAKTLEGARGGQGREAGSESVVSRDRGGVGFVMDGRGTGDGVRVGVGNREGEGLRQVTYVASSSGVRSVAGER